MKPGGAAEDDNVKKWIRTIIDFLNSTKDEHLGAFAGQSAFFIFLSIFPLINIILMLTPFLPFTQEELLDQLIRIFPSDLSGYVRDLLQDIFSNGHPTFTIVAIVTGLWSASKGIMAIRNGLNEICRKRVNNNFFLERGISALYTGGFLLLIFAVVFVVLFGKQVGEHFVENYPETEHLIGFFLSTKEIISFLLIFLLILLMYTALPAKKLLMRYQVIGAGICALAWLLLSWGFSYYVSFSMKKSYMYGSLSTIIMFLLWLYIIVNIILWCAQVNQFLYIHVFKEKADLIVERKMKKSDARKAWLRKKLYIWEKNKGKEGQEEPVQKEEKEENKEKEEKEEKREQEVTGPEVNEQRLNEPVADEQEINGQREQPEEKG